MYGATTAPMMFAAPAPESQAVHAESSELRWDPWDGKVWRGPDFAAAYLNVDGWTADDLLNYWLEMPCVEGKELGPHPHDSAPGADEDEQSADGDADADSQSSDDEEEVGDESPDPDELRVDPSYVHPWTYDEYLQYWDNGEGEDEDRGKLMKKKQ